MTALNNFLTFIYENWIGIATCLLLLIGIGNKAIKWFKKNDQEKIEVAKKQIKDIILKLCSDAESDFSNMIQAGEIKRSQVIQEIYMAYPILEKVTDQEELVKWIDEIIDEALIILREVISKNEDSFVITTKGDE